MNASRGEVTMSNPKPTEAPELTAKTQKLPLMQPRAQEDSEEFLAQQEDVRVMIAANDPLSFIVHDMEQNQHLRESSELAATVQRALGKMHPGPDRGVKQAGFRVLVTAFMPAVLVEIGFGTNPAEARYLRDPRRQREIAASIRTGRPSPALLPPLLLFACLALVWATASGAVYGRPRYLLPVMAATAVHIGVVFAAAWSRARPLAAVSLALILALNVTGMWSRLNDGGPTSDYYRSVLRSLENKGVRTGYADFSLSAPLTMFTRERILLSSRLGPTPAYEPEEQTARVAREGPDAYVLRPDDDPARFEEVLKGLGVTYKVDLDPIPVFYGFSRPVRVEEVHGFRGDTPARPIPDDE